MEDISISFSQEKYDQQTITIVNAADLIEDIEDLEDSPTAVIHHVLEVPMLNGNNDSIILRPDNPHCLICNAKLSASRRGVVNIFSKELKSSSQQLQLDYLLGSILNCHLDSTNTHSDIICKKCCKLVEDYDELENQLLNIKKELNVKYQETKTVVSGGHINYVDDSYAKIISSNGIQIKNVNSRGRLKKRRKIAKELMIPSIKLEVKKEPEDASSISFIESDDPHVQDLIDSVCIHNCSSSEELCVDGSTELDGLDVVYEDGALQFDGMDAKGGNNRANDSILLQMENYKCRFCKMKSSFAEVQRHLVEVHADRLYECEVCVDRLSSRVQLMDHINAHLATGEKPFSCALCNQAFALPRQLKEHLKQHTDGLSCFECARRFDNTSALLRHMNTHNGTLRPFACDHCGKAFASRAILRSHVKTHGARTRSHKCRKCDKLFYTVHHLQEHLRIHQTRRDHVCDACGKAFPTTRRLESHILTHTGIKNFACRICQKAFLRKGEVEDHERVHTGEKPFQCELCGAVFSQRSNLLSHKKATHLQQKNYTCTDCNKAFKRRRLLNYHRQSVHTGERPFRCSCCKASFVYPEHYKKHMRIHTGEKPFKCEICNKAFNSKDNKNAHKFIHSDKKQYECMVCGTGYMRKPQLTQHINQHGYVGKAACRYIKVNSPSIVDAEILGTMVSHNGLTLADDVVGSGLGSLEMVKDAADAVFSRPLHIVESDMSKLILPVGVKADDEQSVGHFLASLTPQIVVRSEEDFEKYTPLTADQIAQISQVAAQGSIGEVSQLPSVAAGEYGAFEIQLDDQDTLTMAVSSQ